MKICILGKYPPIEGGVSASTYWLAYGLAERGHHVCVVTNAGEVEEAYRMRLSPEDEALYAPVFPASGGRVEVLATEPLGPRMTHIPAHNPFATKLAGLATQAIRSRGCDAIFAYYYEPYAIAGYLAAAWTGVPWVVRNAGSDLDRLMAVPELGTAYKEVLRAADGVLTRSPALAGRFLGMGVRSERLFRSEPYAPPRAFFHPGAQPLDVKSVPALFAPPGADFDPTRPTVGIYGKVGTAKGSFDLLHALAGLRQEGLAFQLVALTQGYGLPAFSRAVRELELDDRTWILPFVPNWRIPSFIRACTAVCFLERDFPIKIHAPVVAAEVLATGGCLVLSGEIARKHAAGDALVDGENVLLVNDPKDWNELAGKLRRVIEDPEEAARIGRQGMALAADSGAFSRYVESYETVLIRIAGGETVPPGFAGREDGAADLLRRMPWLAAVLPAEAFRLAESFDGVARPAVASCDPVSRGLAFCEFLRGRLQENHLPVDKDLVEACLQFQVRRWQAQCDNEETLRQMPFGEPDRLGRARISSPEAGRLLPLRSRHADVVELDYDVVPLFYGNGGENGNGHVVAKRPTIVCFLRTPNLRPTELKLTPLAREVLDLCDGSRTTNQVLAALTVRCEVPPDDLRERAFATLQQLYDRHVLVFCDRAAGCTGIEELSHGSPDASL